MSTEIPTIIKVFGENIRAIREKKNLSLLQLEDISKYDNNLITLLENGEKDITLNTAVRIAKALDVYFPYMLSRNFKVVIETMDIETIPKFVDDNYQLVFTDNVKRHLMQNSLSKMYLANIAELEPTTLRSLFAGRKVPLFLTIEKISNAISTDVSELFIRHN